MTDMIIAGTGHRAQDCEPENIVRFKIKQTLSSSPVVKVYIGMANGYDLWFGDEALSLGIEVVAARPWAGHGPVEGDEELYQRVLDGAGEVVNVIKEVAFPGPSCYHARNHYMVDQATHVLAYWSGKKTGGTYACREYAIKVGKPIRNIYDYPPF